MPKLTDAQRAALTARLRRGRTVDAIGRRDPAAADLPLSFGQEQLWFIDRFAPGQAMYNIPLAIAIRGDLDRAALGRALDQLVTRHEVLRTRLVPGRVPVQVVDPPAPVPVTDLRLDPGELGGYIDAEAVRPFSLADGPLIRFSLIRLQADESVLVVAVHHAVFDGWSAGVLLRDLAALYAGTGLAELPVQFADYALWERARPVPAELARYWQETLDGFETVHFPTDRPRPVLEDWDGGLAVRCTGLLDDLRELSRRHSATLFVTLMAGLHAVLARYTGQSDLVVGTVSANRARPEVAPMIGFCVNTLPIRVDLSGDPSFSEVIERVKEATTGAYGHQELPFGKLVDLLKVDRDAGRAPVFQIALAFAERDTSPVQAGTVTFANTDLVAGVHAAKFDLSFLAEVREAGPGWQTLWIECSYKTSLFDAETIERLLAHLECLLHGAAADPGQRVSQLPLLSRAELDAELVTWNDTDRDLPGGCIHEAFEAQARRTPHAVAAELGPERITYAELDAAADRIAAGLRGAGVGPESLVGVCMTTSLVRLATFLGIWKAGGGYVPLDPSLPPDRLAYLIGDAAMPLIVVDEAGAAVLSEGTAVPESTVLPASTARLVRDPGGEAAGQAAGPRATPANVAYVMYTSGSTGQPKGVVIEHRHAVNFLRAMIEDFRAGPADKVLQFSAFTFDVSIVDTYLALLCGGTVVLAAPETLHTPRRLVALMRDHGVTMATLTPSVAVLLGDADLPALRMLLCGGEEMPPELAVRWRGRIPQFVNGYGPTEVTVLATYAVLTPDAPLPPSIGFPLANYQAYVLDEHLNPVPVGVTGELYLGGASVGRGYLGRPELTAGKFIDDPFRPGGRLYKSGDLGHRRRDGSLVHDGRTDHQVKLRGLRIELGEIEATLTAHPKVDQAVVAVTTNRTGARELTGYVSPAGLDLAELREHLGATLPAYMVPASFVTLDDFPLTRNGKIDRRALPAPVSEADPGTPEAPATPAEAAITGLFGEVLGSPVGAADSFFASGGNSLQVMWLIDLIAARTGADLTPAAVFVHPTPRRLAAHLDTLTPVTSPLTPLNSASPGASPLVLIHAVGGTITDYTAFAGLLAGRYAVHGLQAPGLTDGGSTPGTLDELVSRYVELIRAAFPDGPYRLAGWSMGGVVAYEIAARLECDGAEVALLGLLDAPFAVPGDRAGGPDQLAGQFVRDAAQSLGSGLAPAGLTAAEQLDWLAAALGGGDSTREQTREELRRRLSVFSAHSTMLAGYEPSTPVSAPAVVISARDSLNFPARDRWPAVLTGPATVVPVDGDHYSFLRPPAVTAVAEALSG